MHVRKRVVLISWRNSRLLGVSYAHPELSWRDADEAFEVVGELALVRETSGGGDLRHGEIAIGLQEVLGPLDAAGDDVVVRRQPGGRPELPRKVVEAEMGRRRHLLQAHAGQVFLDVLGDGAELPLRERTIGRTGQGAGNVRTANQVDSE